MVETKLDVDRIIRDYVDILTKKIKVDQVILFGPYVEGDVDEWSDIQVAVISPDFTGMNEVERVTLLALSTGDLDVHLMPFGGYTPDEYEHPEKTLHMGWVKARGSVVYEAA
jgi:predicted nucleotidyltransferase